MMRDVTYLDGLWWLLGIAIDGEYSDGDGMVEIVDVGLDMIRLLSEFRTRFFWKVWQIGKKSKIAS